MCYTISQAYIALSVFYWRNHGYTEDIFVCSRTGLGSALRSILKEEKKEKEKVH